jgi:hypothetical protein
VPELCTKRLRTAFTAVSRDAVAAITTQRKAVETVMRQAELLGAEWAA